MQCGLTLAGFFVVLTLAGTPVAAQDRTSCDDLFRVKVENTNLLSSAVVPAEADLPAYCRVLGYVRPAINFEVRLPVQGWNGKFYMTGCGGFCGRLTSNRPGFTNAINYGLRRHYAVSTMDGGHWGDKGTDARWAYGNPVAEADWGYRAVTETARVTKALIERFYGSKPVRSYFAGCSTGGRMAAIEAQRFPDDFDGIISGAPSLDETGLSAIWPAWIVQANTGPAGREILSAAKGPLIRDAVLTACANADGVVDDPRACAFDPKTLRCRGPDGPACLTDAEIGVLEKWYAEPRNSRGEVLVLAVLPRGSEMFWPGVVWQGADGTEASVPGYGRGFLRYMAFPEDPDDSPSLERFDFDRDPRRMAQAAELFNASNPDLRGFRDRGGKLLMYHGWADALTPPSVTTAYWESVAGKMGGGGALSGFYRLFMIPGFGHCGLQPGPGGLTESGLDPLTALELWVERGVAPDVLVTTVYGADGKVARVRPVCPYPSVAKLKGGDANNPANYACVAK